MMFGRKLAGAAAAGAMIMSAMAPTVAQARHYGGGGYYGGGYYGGGYGRHYRHRDRFDVGDAIGIAALIGAVAIIASAADKGSKSTRRTTERSQRENDRDYQGDSRVERGERQDDYAAADSEDAAVNECAMAARDQASTNGRFAEVRGIDTVRTVSDGYDVTGRVEERSDVRASDGALRRFSCTWRNGRVAGVSIGADAIAMR